MNVKKVLIVCHYYPPHPGGIEVVAENQAKRLVAKGFDVTVVTSKVSPREKSDTVDGVRVIRVPAWNILEPKGIPFPLFSPSLFAIMYREVRRADVVHIHDAFYMSSFAAALCARLTDIPTVMTQHVALVPHSSKATTIVQNIVYRTTGKVVFRVAKTIMVLNGTVHSFLNGLGIRDDKILWQPNGVDTDQFMPAAPGQKQTIRKKYGLPENKVIALFVGRFVPKKGFDKVVQSEDSDYLLLMAGGGRKQDNTESINYLGKITPVELADVYRASDIFVLPSEGEGFPLSVQEAMASGLPIVLTNDAGYGPYALDTSRMKLLETREPEEIKAALKLLTRDKKLRSSMSAYSYEYATRHFSWDAVVNTLIALYEQAADDSE